MKQIKGIAHNVNTTILGRITLVGKNVFCRKDEILVCKGVEKIPSGYLAVITDSDLNTDKTYINGIENIDTFCEGDVVSISPQGGINFLYEHNSVHNAVFVTERCNHRCIMCPQPPVSKEQDKTEFNMKLISLFDKNTQSIGITGGEPTMIGDKLFDVVRQIKKCCPKASVDMLTNGVKFSEWEYAVKLARCNHNDFQIDIPIFSDIADEHNRIVGAKTFYKTVQGIYNLASLNQQIGIRIVVHKQTYKRLSQLADYIYHNFPFVCQVAFLQMETTGLANENLKDLWIDPYDYNEQLQEAVTLLDNRDIPVYIYNAQLCVLPENIRNYAMQSITDWKDGFLPECEGCKLRDRCAGVFTTNGTHVSKHIRRIECTDLCTE